MIVNFEDYLFEQILNESLINEKINLNKIIDIVKNISNKGDVIVKLIKKINNSHNFLQRKYLATVLIILFIGNFAIKNNRWGGINHKNIEKTSTEIAKQTDEIMDIDKIKDIAKPILTSDASYLDTKVSELENIRGVNLNTVKVSNSAKNFIKNHEKLRLVAYSIGDGMVTIGYGHAHPETDSKYNIGEQITKERAEYLFNLDVKEAEDGVKRLLKEWEDKGIDVKITQSMFDAMVSMAYNMGVSGFRTSEFLQHLKNEDYMTAAELIKSTKVKSKIKNEDGNYITIEMPGLIDRRLKESELFIKDIS